jgi:hypothetical protein
LTVDNENRGLPIALVETLQATSLQNLIHLLVADCSSPWEKSREEASEALVRDKRFSKRYIIKKIRPLSTFIFIFLVP